MDLTINSGAVKLGDNELIASDISFSTEQETATLTFPSELPVGDAQLDLTFSGTLNDKMKGFYRSKYYTPSGEERFGAVTQLYVRVNGWFI